MLQVSERMKKETFVFLPFVVPPLATSGVGLRGVRGQVERHLLAWCRRHIPASTQTSCLLRVQTLQGCHGHLFVSLAASVDRSWDLISSASSSGSARARDLRVITSARVRSVNVNDLST
jgi:hypothetical protein